jgi:uncharacterized protein YtpQ (UPF0354 family)
MTFCSRAIACLKVPVEDDKATPVIELTFEDSPIISKLENGFWIVYLVDTGYAFQYICQKDLKKEGISRKVLHQIGLKNLKNLAKQYLKILRYENIFGILVEGNFEASMLLLSPLWENIFIEYIKGDFLVAVPSRDVIAFGDSFNASTMSELKALIDRIWPNGKHLLSNQIFKYSKEQWGIRVSDSILGEKNEL